MKGIAVCALYLALWLGAGHVACPNPERRFNKTLSKVQILSLLGDQVRKLFSAEPPENNGEESLKRYTQTVKSLTYCMGNADLTKRDLVECLINVMEDQEIVPPAPLLNCIGDYLMCTGAQCFAKLSEKINKKAEEGEEDDDEDEEEDREWVKVS